MSTTTTRLCRRPSISDSLKLGCAGVEADSTDVNNPAFPAASQEVSCNVVERHRPRSALFVSNLDNAGRHAPTMQTFPLLRNKDGTVLSVDPTTDGALSRPRLLGPCLDVTVDSGREDDPGSDQSSVLVRS